MNNNILIGIDIGTSGAKAAVMERSGRLLAWAGQEYPILTPRAGWAEENPEDWLAAVVSCITEALRQARVEPQDVAGIGLAGQMHSLVCLNARGEPVRPAILWADQRSAAQVRALEIQIGWQRLAEWIGNPIAAGFMLPSWRWLVENEPDTVAATKWLLLPKDYVRYRLTGNIGSEPSDASSTALFDPHRLCWSVPMLEQAGLEAERLPPLFPSGSVAGGLLPEIAKSCGLVAGTPVIFGASDVSAQALAQGIIEPGTVSCTIGTGGQLFAPLAAPQHDPDLRMHLFCHCLRDTWHQESAILTAGLALRWLRDQVFPGADYARLADAAAGVEAGTDGLFFLPFLAGERTPYMNPELRAGFVGMRLHHRQANLVRAVMEGVVFALRQGLELMQSLGTPIERLVATGGATRHPLWLQLQADIFNRPVYISSAEEATARGAALLAGIGAGVYADAREAVRVTVAEAQPGAQPDEERVNRYAQAYQKYADWAQTFAEKYPVNPQE
jgi:xylulokinase